MPEHERRPTGIPAFSLSVFFLAPPFSFAPPRIFSPVPPLSRSATDIISSGPLFCHRSATVNSAKRRFRTKRRPDNATKSFSLPPARPSHSAALFQRPFFSLHPPRARPYTQMNTHVPRHGPDAGKWAKVVDLSTTPAPLARQWGV